MAIPVDSCIPMDRAVSADARALLRLERPVGNHAAERSRMVQALLPPVQVVRSEDASLRRESTLPGLPGFELKF